MSAYRRLRRCCSRCGAALLLAGSVCFCMLGQSASISAANSAVRTNEVMEGTTGEYILRPGDTVSVNYRFTPEFDDTETISPDGRIALKNIGAVTAAGDTIDALQRAIVKASSTQLVNPDVSVTLKDFERAQIVVGGDVNLPSRFDLRKPTTALGAILMAGGPKENAAMGHVYLFRRMNSDIAETYVLNLGHLRAGQHPPDDILLRPDDMILVRHDKLTTVERYMKLVNLGVYFNPIGNGLF